MQLINMYNRFPSYKLNDLCLPLYIFLVEDGNGESEVVAVWMIQTDDADSIRQMAEIFKKHNKWWSDTVTIIANKEFIERDALKSEFPKVLLIPCSKERLQRNYHRQIRYYKG